MNKENETYDIRLVYDRILHDAVYIKKIEEKLEKLVDVMQNIENGLFYFYILGSLWIIVSMCRNM